MCDHFNEAELLQEYMEGLPSLTPVHKALLQLLKAGNDKSRVEDALRACRAVDVMGSQDPDILILLFQWIRIASIPQETIACARLARSFAVDSSSANPLAFILGNEATAYALLHDYAHFLASAQEALQVARGAKPRIQMRVAANLASEFALIGCRSRIQEDLALARRNNPPPDVRDRFLIADLVEATEAFRMDEANRILERLSRGCGVQPYYVYLAYSMQELLQTYVRMFPGQKPNPVYTPFDSGVIAPGGREEIAMICTIYGHLFNRRPEEALKAVYEMYKALGESLLTNPGTNGYLLTRCELANGNSNAARRALNVRKDAGLKAPLDTFFHARIALLQQDSGSADALFRESIANMDALNARNRLIFELALSAEIPIPVLMEWIRFLNEPPVAGDALVSRIEQQNAIPALEPGSRPKSNVSQRIIRHASPGVTRLIGDSHEMATLRQFIKRMAHQDVPVLITGQTGTGKDVVARAIHEESSRTAHPFTAINCAALGENLLCSELFGHERGAFTGASAKYQGLIRAAGKGTLFLDEIGEISSNMQAALLRVLETGEFRPVGSTKILSMECRIIAATNRDLAQEVQEGRFREDLFYRLRRQEIRLSPLSQRKEDIAPLSHFFFNYDRTGSERVRLHANLEAALKAYAWPGNIRELRNTIERIRLFHGDKTEYGLNDLLNVIPTWNAGVPPARAAVQEAPSPVPSASTVQDMRSPALPNSVSERSTIRMQEAVLHLFRKYGNLTRKELMTELQVAPNTATHYLNRLIDAGYIEKVELSRSSRSNYYRLIKRPEGTGPRDLSH